MAESKHHEPESADTPDTGERDQRPAAKPEPDRGGTPGAVGSGLSGGVTDIDRRDGEADDSNSGYSDEDLMRTGGGGIPR